MTTVKVSERTFLKDLAIQRFNLQKGYNYTTEQFDIQSVTPEYGKALGYEIVTIVLGDFVRLRIYLDITDKDSLQPFILKVSPPFQEEALDDEVFVALGSVDSSHRIKDGYGFKTLFFDPTLLPIITTASNGAIILANGGFLLLG